MDDEAAEEESMIYGREQSRCKSYYSFYLSSLMRNQFSYMIYKLLHNPICIARADYSTPIQLWLQLANYTTVHKEYRTHVTIYHLWL